MSIANPFTAQNKAFQNISLFDVTQFFVIFPYLQLVPLGSDSQPYALIFALAFCIFVRRLIIEPQHIFLLAVPVIAFGFVIGDFSISSIRGFYGYLSLTALFITGYNGYLLYGPPSYRFLRNSLFILIAAGLLQMFVHPNITSFITSRGFGYGGRGGRGVESLTPEPTFLGFLCLIFLLFPVLFDEYTRKQKRSLIFLSIFLLVFISRSSSGILTLGFALSCAILLLIVSYALQLRRKVNLLVLLSAIMVFFSSSAYIAHAISVSSNVRFIKLVELLLVSPKAAIARDPSLSDRFAHIYVSITSLKDGHGLPHGFSTWNDYLFDQVPNISYITNVGGADGRVMSFFGSGVYELGIFSIPLFFILTFPMIRGRMEIRDIAAFLGLAFLLVQSVPTGLATTPFVLGMIAARSKHQGLGTSTHETLI